MEPIKYMTSLFTFYLKGEIKNDNNFVVFKTPNTILGLIPLGSKVEKYVIDQIASVSTNFKVKFGKLLLGILFLSAAFSGLNDNGSIGAFILALLFAAGFLLDAFELDLIVATSSGEKKIIDFLILDKAKAHLAEKQINDMISGRLYDTNVREHADRIVDAINNK